jgi:hypothetical protein
MIHILAHMIHILASRARIQKVKACVRQTEKFRETESSLSISPIHLKSHRAHGKGQKLSNHHINGGEELKVRRWRCLSREFLDHRLSYFSFFNFIFTIIIRFPVQIPKFYWNIGPLMIFWFMFLSLCSRILNNQSEPCNLVLAWFILHTDLNAIFSLILFYFSYRFQSTICFLCCCF